MTRLDDFENKNLKSDVGDIIPDQDMLFLKKEVSRYRGSLDTMQAQKDAVLDESIKIDFDMKKESQSI